MYDRKMFEVTKYLTITNHAYPEFILAMNEKSFQRLTPEQQKIVTDAANEVRDELRKNAKAEDMAALEKLKEKGMQVYVVPEAELPAGSLLLNQFGIFLLNILGILVRN